MISKKSRHLFFFLIFSLSRTLPAHADTFFGSVPTGLLQLDSFHYPVFLFVPPTYKPAVSYPLIIAIPDTKDPLEKFANEWSRVAKKKSALVLIPGLLPREGDVPYNVDTWLLKVKEDVRSRYHITPGKIFLIGKGRGAHYAAYLGIKYPEQFSAVALLEGSWVGPYEKMMRFKSRPRKQVPFYAVIPESNQDLVKKTEAIAYRLTKKGYPVYLEKLKDAGEIVSDPFQMKVLNWLDEQSQVWSRAIQESEKNWKEKTHQRIEELFLSK